MEEVAPDVPDVPLITPDGRLTKIVELEQQVQEYEQLFELQRSRMKMATKVYRDMTGTPETIWPDLGDLLNFFIGEHQRADAGWAQVALLKGSLAYSEARWQEAEQEVSRLAVEIEALRVVVRDEQTKTKRLRNGLESLRGALSVKPTRSRSELLALVKDLLAGGPF
jgi:hypothetical protein